MMRIKQVTKDYVALEVSERLVRQDYDLVVPELERLMAVNEGHLNVLLEVHGFKGWDPETLGASVEFDVKQSHRDGRVAIVTEAARKSDGRQIARPLLSGTQRFFELGARSEAESWLRGSSYTSHERRPATY